MTRYQNLFDACEEVVDELRELEDDDARSGRLFTLRRKIQAAQDEYIKQGDQVMVTKEFEIRCTECNEIQMREEDYYLHLRQKHKYPDEDAATECNNPRTNYEQGLQQLRTLLAEFTEVQLNDG